VSYHGDRLREAFETHEHLAPDPAAVYARVQALARAHRRRRRGAQAAGGAVLGAGLIAGVVTLPGVLPGQSRDTTFPMVAPAAPAPSSAPTQRELDARWNAYFAAGYDYDDAIELAKLWNSDLTPGKIKAEAGRRLLAGETLPIRPTPEETQDPPAADPDAMAAVEKFFAAGYVWEDAERLARLWKLADPYEAKAEGGERLLDGKKLPFRPKPGNVAAAREAARVEAFFSAGYDYQDAVKLAELWQLADAYQAKIVGGKRLLAGDTLPIQP
jgi:hypothetical protein